jgi:hypothetical protein
MSPEVIFDKANSTHVFSARKWIEYETDVPGKSVKLFRIMDVRPSPLMFATGMQSGP